MSSFSDITNVKSYDFNCDQIDNFEEEIIDSSSEESKGAHYLLQLEKFINGADLSEYIESLEENTENGEESIFLTLDLEDMQAILLLLLAKWTKEREADYIKLFIQILPHYLFSVEYSNAEKQVKSYLPEVLLLSHPTGNDNEFFNNSFEKILIDSPPAIRTVEKEFTYIKDLLLHFGMHAIKDCPTETFACALSDWEYCQQPDAEAFAIVMQKFLGITQDWTASPCVTRKVTCYFELSMHLLTEFFDSKLLYAVLCERNITLLEELSENQIGVLFKTAVEHKSFRKKAHKELSLQQINKGAITLACKVSRGLEEYEIDAMLTKLEKLPQLDSYNIQAIKDILSTRWVDEGKEEEYLYRINELGNKIDPSVFIFLHNKKDKADGLSAYELDLMLDCLSRKTTFLPSDIQAIRDILAFPWNVDDSTYYLNFIDELLEKVEPSTFIFLHNKKVGSDSLVEVEIDLMLKRLGKKTMLLPCDIQAIKDILAFPWKIEQDTCKFESQLEVITKLAEKTIAYKYVILHKVKDKHEEIASNRRIAAVKRLVEDVKVHKKSQREKKKAFDVRKICK